MRLTENIKESIKKHALEEYPNECCGLIINNKQIESLRCKNISENPQKHFIINPKDYLIGEQLGQILGIYHSHNSNANFSFLDKINASGNKLISIIYDVNNNKFNEYYPGINKFLNKTFTTGINDCYTLIKDYYKEELNIELKDYERKKTSYIGEKTIFSDNFKKENAIKILNGPINNENINLLQNNDVIIFKYHGIESHIAVYIGNNILHHKRNKLSCIEPFSEIYQRKVAFVLRHKNLL